MTSAGCARGITISGALGTVRAHGEYNYRQLNVARTLIRGLRRVRVIDRRLSSAQPNVPTAPPMRLPIPKSNPKP